MVMIMMTITMIITIVIIGRRKIMIITIIGPKI